MARDFVVVVVALLNAALGAYGIWQVINGWRAKRRGGDGRQLMMAGAARLLLSSGIWVSISFLSGWSGRLGPITGRLVFGISVAFMLLSVIVDARRRQLMREAQG